MKKLLLLAMLISLSSFTPSLKMKKVIDKATWQSKQFVIYYGGYIKIKYPNGDVPKNLGVCTDVIIRAYRTIGVDLQQLVHEDMLKNKAVYDKRQYSKVIDKNIDHRRTNNLRTYFTRQHAKKAITNNAGINPKFRFCSGTNKQYCQKRKLWLYATSKQTVCVFSPRQQNTKKKRNIRFFLYITTLLQDNNTQKRKGKELG